MPDFTEVKEIIKSIDRSELIKFIPRVALQIEEEKIETASFVFWLSYMVEHDLDTVLAHSWKMAKEHGPGGKEVIEFIKQEYGIHLEKIDPEDPEYEPISITFNHRIRVYEDMFGEDERAIFLKKIKGLRNDISHLRVHDLEYEGSSLYSAETKRRMLIDYFETMFEKETSESKIWKELSEEEREEVNRIYKKWEEGNN